MTAQRSLPLALVVRFLLLEALLPFLAVAAPTRTSSGAATTAAVLVMLVLWIAAAGDVWAGAGAGPGATPGGRGGRERSLDGEEVCEHNLQHTVANCSGRDLDRVPWGMHHSMETLDLCHNRFSNLEPNAFKAYSNLRKLRLCHNSLSSLNRDSLAKLKRLHSLDLSGNHFVNIPTEVLNTLPTLLRLDLSGNNLVTVRDEAFRGLRNLKVLDLSANRISAIEPNALLGLPNLQVLKLEKNALRWLSPTLFEHLSPHMLQLHLYVNPWLCDCKVRHMRQWMANGTSAIWQQPGHTIRCEGPSISLGKPLSSIPLDELACRVEMRTSGSTKTVSRGQEVMLECIYFSMPPAKPIWQRNQMPINFAANHQKYVMTTEGSPVTITRLYIRDFQYTDIMEYECLAHNIRGSDSTVFKVTLKGVPFHSVSHHTPSAGSSGGTALGLNSKSIVVGVAVVCGIILVTVFSLLIYYCVRHFRRQERERQDAVVESVKKHFLTSEEMVAGGEGRTAGSTKLDQLHHPDAITLDPARSKEKAATQGGKQSGGGGPQEREPLYTFQQHDSPVASGNTYVSFSTEVIEPEVYPIYPQQNRTSIYDESQAESKTPLLNRGGNPTAAASDADESSSVDDALHSHVYESISVYRARRSQHFDPSSAGIPPAHHQSRSSSHSSTPVGRAGTGSTTNHPDYQDYREIGHLGHGKTPKKDAAAPVSSVSRKSKNPTANPGSVSEQRNSPGGGTTTTTTATPSNKECIEMVPQQQDSGTVSPHKPDDTQQ